MPVDVSKSIPQKNVEIQLARQN